MVSSWLYFKFSRQEWFSHRTQRVSGTGIGDTKGNIQFNWGKKQDQKNDETFLQGQGLLYSSKTCRDWGYVAATWLSIGGQV